MVAMLAESRAGKMEILMAVYSAERLVLTRAVRWEVYLVELKEIEMVVLKVVS